MAIQRGDVVLVPFPFTDLTSQKVRPAVVVSPDNTGEDVLLAFVSSTPAMSPIPLTDLPIPADHPEFSNTGLKKASVVKAAKLLALHKTKILRRLGRLGPVLVRELDAKLKLAVGVSSR